VNLYHVQYDCGDYYCDSMHTLGIFANEELAKEGIEKFKEELSVSQTLVFVYRTTVRVLDEVEEIGE
jgi:hypothetical protein